MASALAILAVVLLCGQAASAQSADDVPPGYASDVVQIRFNPGTDVVPVGEALPPAILAEIDSADRLFSLSQERLAELRSEGEDNTGEPVPDPNLWVEIVLDAEADPEEIAEALRSAENIDVVQFAPLPPPSPATPDFTARQGYLGSAPDGIAARYAWTFPGGNGDGVTTYDVEYGWNQNHEDLSKAAGLPLLLRPGDTAIDPFNDPNHGTAVLGQLIADKDGKGVTGIAWGADVGLAPANTALEGYNLANAILLAIDDGEAGDVILIEQQACVCNLACDPNTQFGYGPSEWIQSVFDAIQVAVANGFVVVEAAGNGSVDLDQAACGTAFDRDVRDSGAIIVGAGGPPGSGQNLERLFFSSYGSRIDLQGWGSGVVTTGYGDLYVDSNNPGDPDAWYTDTFSGTSSASPMVAGAAANLQGIALGQFQAPLLPSQVRAVLAATGTPQQGNTAENIGPRPDLRPAIDEISRGQLGEDTSPPECGPLRLTREGGQVVSVAVSPFDLESGIASVELVRLSNAEAFVGGSGPFAQGRVAAFSNPVPDSVQLVARKIDRATRSTVVIEVENGVGLTTRCDPVLTTLSAEVPEAFELEQNYPNPFNPATKIRFRLAERSDVRLAVYDVMGREVAVLVGEPMEAGTYEVAWEGADAAGRVLPSGVYLYRLTSGSFSQSRTMTLLK